MRTRFRKPLLYPLSYGGARQGYRRSPPYLTRKTPFIPSFAWESTLQR
jgi:hypothetical protein